LENGADCCWTALYAACSSFSIDVIDYLLYEYDFHDDELNDALEAVAETGNQWTAQDLIEKGATNISSALVKAVGSDNHELVEMLVELSNNNNWTAAMNEAIKCNDEKLINRFLHLGACDWESMRTAASQAGNTRLVDMCNGRIGRETGKRPRL